MRWLITGSNGFIGSALAEHLKKDGHSVVGVERNGPYDFSEGIKFVAPDCIFHAAGPSSVQDSWEDPAKDFRDSVVLWQSLLDGVRLSGLKPKIFFPSSAAVFGEPDFLTMTEHMAKRPISPYGFHKLGCEHIAHMYAELYQLPIVICRLFSVFGEGQKRLLIWEIVRQILEDQKEITLQGTGLEWRDYMHVDDFAEAVNLLSKKDASYFQVYNFGVGTSMRITSLVCIIQKLLGTKKNIVFGEKTRTGDPITWQCDNSAILRMIPEWNPAPFEDRLARCIWRWKNDF